MSRASQYPRVPASVQKSKKKRENLIRLEVVKDES